jgi:hypothetical protein
MMRYYCDWPILNAGQSGSHRFKKGFLEPNINPVMGKQDFNPTIQ